MVVFGREENGYAVFSCNKDESFFLKSFLITPNVQGDRIILAFPDICEDKIPTITLPASIAQELFHAGKLRFEK